MKKQCSVRDDLSLFKDKVCNCSENESKTCLKMKGVQLEICTCLNNPDGGVCDQSCNVNKGED